MSKAAEKHEPDDDLPKGIQLTTADPVFNEDPYAILDKVMAHGPILNDAELGRFFISGHELVKELIRDRRLGADPRKSLPDSYVRLLFSDEDRITMMFMDDPEHKRLRSLVNQAFTTKSVETLRPYTEEAVKNLFDEMEGETEVDFMAKFADPFSIIVVSRMMGVEPEYLPHFKALTADVLITFDPFRTPEMDKQFLAAWHELGDYFRAKIEARRNDLKNDIISDFLRAETEDGKLSDDEIVRNCLMFLTAGNVTVSDTIGNGLHALLKHPDQLAKLKANPDLMENAIEEMLRYDGPVTDTTRLPLKDIEVRGCPIEKGRTITLSLASVAHDPSINPEPHRFDIERKNITHMAFGGGVHKCIGAPLARMEIDIVFRRLLERFPNIALGDGPLVRRTRPFFHGLEKLPVRLK